VIAAPTPRELVFEVLPAREGDALLLTWGLSNDRHRMLVDVGPAPAYDDLRPRLTEVAREGPIDLLVMTHIDKDHIEGAILLTNDAEVNLTIREVWFNGSGQLVPELNALHGEIFSKNLRKRRIPWNVRFDRGPVCATAAERPARKLPGGLQVTVLGPDRAMLPALRDHWDEVCIEAGLKYGTLDEALDALRRRRKLEPDHDPFLGRPDPPDVEDLASRRPDPDTAIANRSSIVLMVEYGDRRLLLAGDATPSSLTAAVKGLLEERGLPELPLTVFKLPHHGSARNLTKELVRLLPAEHYVFSSDGRQFPHPDDTAVAIVLQRRRPGAELVFNYRNPRTRKWDDDRLEAVYHYRVRYPEPGQPGVRIEWTAES
jgi:beta-lactamase superfamily II metal-dependent hydrolase